MSTTKFIIISGTSVSYEKAASLENRTLYICPEAYKWVVQMVIDWECARFTKPDKPLDAYDTLYKFYPHMEDKILPILKELNLTHEN